MTTDNLLPRMSVIYYWLAAATFCVLLPQVGWTQSDVNALTPHEFAESLTPAERKLPQNVVVDRRLAAGLPVPHTVSQRLVSSQASRSATVPDLFQIHGTETSTLLKALKQMGVTAQYASSSRPYVTAALTQAQVAALAENEAVTRIGYIVGPTAQGTTDAYTAHRVGGLALSPQSLTGSGVVVGVISLPYQSDDLSDLSLASPRIVPESANLYSLLDAVDSSNTYGTTDLLYLLQLIYDLAPGASVVLASPGVNSTAGQMHDVIDTLVAGTGQEGDSGYVPAVNIIVDDLFYPNQNPFEVDEIAEAVIAATASGVLYITASGDHGHLGASTSSTYIDILDAISLPSGEPFDTLADEFVQEIHRFDSGTGYLEVDVALKDICLFWNEDPSGADFNNPIAHIFDQANNRIGLPVPFLGAGSCLSERGWTGGVLAPGYKFILENVDAPTNFRFLAQGIPDSTDLASADAFDQTTVGNLRGHAYYPDALTVGAVEICESAGGGSILPYNDASCEDISAESYSADAEAAVQQRFYWQSNGSGGYQAISNGALPTAKPDVSAIGSSTLRRPSGSFVNYEGTSASAAVVAGIAANYWQYAKATYTSLADETLLKIVRHGLENAVIDADEAAFDSVTGAGVVDAPKALPAEDDLFAYPAVTASATAKSAGGVFSFDAASSIGASYVLTCASGGAALSAEFTAKTVNPGTPYPFEAVPGSVVSCTVTGTLGTLVDTDTAAATATSVTPTAVSVTSDVGGVRVNWATDPQIANTDMLTVALTCTQDAATLYTDSDVSGSTYFIQTEDDANPVSCTVVSTLRVNDGAPTPINSVTTGATPESISSGLPIWLLYIATQPSE